MIVNNQIFGNGIGIDTSQDTVTASTLSYGITAHDSLGQQITGNAQAFSYDNNGLFQYPETVIIPNTVTSLSNSIRSFNGHTEIKHIIFEEGGTIPSGGVSTFANCSNLESVVLPDSITSIGNMMFSNCSKLNEINIPQNLVSIGSSAFSGCIVTEFVLPDTVTTLSNSAFASCRQLNSINIPTRITSIPTNCFDSCTSLASIIIPFNVTALNSNCFYGSGLTSITIPETVTTMQQGVFRNCTSLKAVVFGGIPTCSYYNLNNANNPFYGCSALEDVQLPAGWTENLLLSFGNNLTHDSMVAMIESLYDYSDGTAHTLTVGSTNLAKLSTEEIAVATVKNWTVS